MSARLPIAVVGISGFVGSHVARALLERGHPVHGTLRDVDAPRATRLREALGSLGELTLHAADVTDRRSLEEAFEDCDGVVMSAGVEHQEPHTLHVMLSAAENTLRAASSCGIERVVFTSSTGSTNPPGGEPECKREDEHRSDPYRQISAGKYSPAAKTLMEARAFGLGEELDVRVATLNPSMIVGCGITGPSQAERFIGAILSGERFADGAPDGSMSMIDVRDLAALHLAALERSDARGRYFGVVRSWHWQDILEALARVAPDWSAPSWADGRERARPTQFDTTRRDSLGVDLRGLEDMLRDLLAGMSRRI